MHRETTFEKKSVEQDGNVYLAQPFTAGIYHAQSSVVSLMGVLCGEMGRGGGRRLRTGGRGGAKAGFEMWNKKKQTAKENVLLPQSATNVFLPAKLG